jgi:hypothetical protein
MPGPIPERSDRRRRANKPAVAVDAAPAATRVSVPAASKEWHPAATRWYRSLKKSGQSRFYEPSDWAQAWVWAELLSRALEQEDRPPAMLIATWAAGATELLTTEGARRRLRLELQRPGQVDEDAEAAVTALDEFRARYSS